MAIMKLLLVVVGVAAQEYGVTPPNVRPPTEQLREQRGAECIAPRLLVLYKALLWSWALLEGSVTVALSGYSPPALARPLLRLLPASSPDPTALAQLTTPTPAFFVGTLLVLAGALLRAHCYRALGRHFTFELAIRPAHALVTRGVYGVVRHPSYAGIVGLAVGWLLCVLDPRGAVAAVVARAIWGSASWSGGSTTTTTAVLACVWAANLGILFVGMSGRMDKEDAMLEKNFGEEWRAWVKRVPWRLIPGVY